MIAADGAGSVIRRNAKIPGPRECLVGIQTLIGKEPDGIHIHLGKNIAPGFFGWEVPHHSGTIVGLASRNGNAMDYLVQFLKKKGWERKVISIFAGMIPLGRVNRSIDEGLMLVGDAACQVKPLSGGGLYTGLISAKHCASTALKALEMENNRKEVLKGYHEAWQEEIGPEISKGLWISNIFRNLSDEQLDDLFMILKKEKVKKVIEDQGDIDYPSTLAKPVLKSAPQLLKFTGPFVKSLF